MKNSFFLVALIFFTSSFYQIRAQEFEVPTHYRFETIEDYGFYRDDIIKAINWLETTPLNEELEKRDLANQFLFQWLSGSPSISINIYPYVMDISQENPHLMMVFMGAWAKHQIQYEEKNSLNLNMQGISSILNLYKLGGGNKDKNVEMLIRLQEKGKLEQWIKERIG